MNPYPSLINRIQEKVLVLNSRTEAPVFLPEKVYSFPDLLSGWIY